MTSVLPNVLPNPRTTGCIVQVRLGSTRLPKKALLEVGGDVMLGHLFRRAHSLAELRDYRIVVATTENDHEIASFCRERGVDCFMGDEHDVTLRLLDCAEHFGFTSFVRLQGDDPLVCPYGILAVLRAAADRPADITTTAHYHGWPVGTASMVMDTAALRALHTRWLRHDPERLRIGFVPLTDQGLDVQRVDRDADWDVDNRFFTIDWEQDFSLFRDVMDAVRPWESGYDFALDAVYDAIAQGGVTPGNGHLHEPFDTLEAAA